MDDEQFRDLIASNLTCRLEEGKDCGNSMEEFLSRCFYQPVRRGALMAACRLER